MADGRDEARLHHFALEFIIDVLMVDVCIHWFEYATLQLKNNVHIQYETWSDGSNIRKQWISHEFHECS